MPHEKLAGIGVTTELAGEERTVIVVWIVCKFHWTLSEAREGLAKLLSVHVILIQPGHDWLLLGF